MRFPTHSELETFAAFSANEYPWFHSWRDVALRIHRAAESKSYDADRSRLIQVFAESLKSPKSGAGATEILQGINGATLTGDKSKYTRYRAQLKDPEFQKQGELPLTSEWAEVIMVFVERLDSSGQPWKTGQPVDPASTDVTESAIYMHKNTLAPKVIICLDPNSPVYWCTSTGVQTVQPCVVMWHELGHARQILENPNRWTWMFERRDIFLADTDNLLRHEYPICEKLNIGIRDGYQLLGYTAIDACTLHNDNAQIAKRALEDGKKLLGSNPPKPDPDGTWVPTDQAPKWKPKPATR